jgi:tetratricopeptide (TPR) repeat protein
VRARCLAGMLAVTTAMIALPRASAAAQIPDHFENLQVLPKDISRDSLQAVMEGFTRALGVRCSFCHVQDQDTRRTIYKSDDKPEKRNARFMLKMVDSLNQVVLAAMPMRADPPVSVTCVTCHRGLMRPTTLNAVLAATVQRAGVDSAIAQYRSLRENPYEGKYDFSEATIDELAQELGASGKTAEAISLLQMNQEFYPKSGQIDVLLGDLHKQRGERDAAITSYRAALEKQPRNRQARQRLTELGVTPPPAPSGPPGRPPVR